MKPKTKIQKEVARLSANLRPISTTQIEWAYRHCVEHIGYRTKKGNITCSDCGHEWHSDSGLCDTLEGCTCSQCHAKLKVQDTRKRIYKETQYFSVITICKKAMALLYKLEQHTVELVKLSRRIVELSREMEAKWSQKSV